MKTFPLKETRIEEAGVMRCCLATVATELEKTEVKIGDKSHCHYCKIPFVLTESSGKHPVWKPVWQLKDWSPIP